MQIIVKYTEYFFSKISLFFEAEGIFSCHFFKPKPKREKAKFYEVSFLQGMGFFNNYYQNFEAKTNLDQMEW